MGPKAPDVGFDAPVAQVSHPGADLYERLVLCPSHETDIARDADFDQHVIASILAVSIIDHGDVAKGSGLDDKELDALLRQRFPLAKLDAATIGAGGGLDDEAAMLRDLLLGHRSCEAQLGSWLAAMIARRAMEPNHLWEDLGLRNRAELSRMLMRHFAPLAERNTRNMRWKRFFYRMLCEDDGFVLCTTPVCTDCSDFDLCFGDETGESRMAERRRDSLRSAHAPSSHATDATV